MRKCTYGICALGRLPEGVPVFSFQQYLCRGRRVCIRSMRLLPMIGSGRLGCARIQA